MHYKLWARAVRIHVKRPAFFLFFAPLKHARVFFTTSRGDVPDGACVRVRRKLQKHELVNSSEGHGLVVVWWEVEEWGRKKKEGLEVAGPGSPEISQNSTLPITSYPSPLPLPLLRP